MVIAEQAFVSNACSFISVVDTTTGKDLAQAFAAASVGK